MVSESKVVKEGIVTLSVSLRVILNVEALNMAETTGSYVKHRKAPIVVLDKQTGTYSVIYVPSISGESLAHAYQEILTMLAMERNLPVTEMDKAGFFMKYADNNIISNYYRDDLAKVLGCEPDKVVSKLKNTSIGDVEKVMLKASVVADVGGFLYTDKLLRRTSPIRFSYLVPALDAVMSGAAAVVPQLHVRYTPEAKRREQALFYIESGSALYTLTVELLVSEISRLHYSKDIDKELEEQRPKRIETAIDALIAMLDGMIFGAKRSRYLPQWDVQSLVAAVSRGPVEFVVNPGTTKDYIVSTYNRAVELTENISSMEVYVYAYDKEGCPMPEPKDASGIFDGTAKTHTEAMIKAKKKALELLGIKGEREG